jgi:hypothetical protein
MKSFVFCSVLALFLIALGSNSCNKDKEPFIGSWEIQTSHVDTLVNNVVVDDTTITYDPGDLWIEIKEENTGFLHDNGSLSYFTWSVAENIIAVKFTGQATLYLEYTLDEPTFSWIVTTINMSNYPNPGDNFKVVRHETSTRM